MIGPQDGVTMMRGRRRWMALVALAGSVVAASAAAQTSAPMEFPPTGSRWITRSLDQAGGSYLTTYTVLEPGSFQGRPGFRLSNDIGVLFFERAGRNWFATVVREKERSAATPHFGTFAWPLEVGKSWSSVYEFRDNLRGLRFNRVQASWRVAAEEEVTVPAGRFRAFRLEGGNNGNTWTTWYAPLVRLVVKEIHERKAGHPSGPGRTVTEVVRYAAPGGDPWYGFGLEPGQAAVRRGEGRRAAAFYESVAQEFEARGLPIEAAQALVDLARIARPVGAIQQGLRAGLRAIDLLKGAPRNDVLLADLAGAYLFVGALYRSAGSLGDAQRFFEEGAQLSPAFASPPRRLFWAGAFGRSLGELAYARHDYPGAAQQAAEAVKQFEQYLATQSASGFDPGRRSAQRNLVLTLSLVGNIERRARNNVAAAQALNRAVQVARDLGAIELELGARNSLGYLALSKPDVPEALRQLEEAKRIANATGNSSFVMWASNGIGRAHFKEGRYPEALETFKEAVTMAEGLRGSLQDAALRSGFLEDKQEMYHGAVWSAVALRKPDEAFALAERARSRAFLDLLGTQTVLSKGKTRALVDEEVRLRGRLAATKAAMEEAGEDDAADTHKEAEAAERGYREFLDRVRKENLEQASLMSVEPVNVPELQALLPEGTTLVEYLVSRNASFAWVITRASVRVVRLPVLRDELLSEVRAFRRGIEGQAPLPDAQKSAEALHERLFAPVRPHIKGSRVVVVPHDLLHYLPFGALRSKAGRWLVEDYTLSTLPSASVLKFLEAKRTAGGGSVLAIGNPDLGAALNLRYAEREAWVVADHYAGATVLVRQDATETRAKALADGARLLHFATHGELNERDPLASGLLLTPGGGDDGRLEVREILGLDLKAQLVVLSACETGLGQLSTGDELVGMQRAFLYAGTPAVVTTLWKVDDRASFALMREFYDRLATVDAGQALQAAQRAAMKEFPHPFAWAAFGLTGVSR
jgi:CHAT domain-containing protein